MRGDQVPGAVAFAIENGTVVGITGGYADDVYRAEGCPKCQRTGFYDRIGIYEMIKVNDHVRKMIIEKRDAAYIREQCISLGLRTMFDDGIQKVLDGITTLEEVVRVIRE